MNVFSNLQDHLLQVVPSARDFPLKWTTNVRSNFCRVFIFATAGIHLGDRLMRSAMYRKDKEDMSTDLRSSPTPSTYTPMSTSQGDISRLAQSSYQPLGQLGGGHLFYKLTPSYDEAPYFLQADALSGNMWYKVVRTNDLNFRLIVNTIWDLESSYKYSIIHKDGHHNHNLSAALQGLKGAPIIPCYPVPRHTWATELYTTLPVLLVCLITDSPNIGARFMHTQPREGIHGTCNSLTTDHVQITIPLHPSSVHLNRLLHMWNPTHAVYTHVRIKLTQSDMRRYLGHGQCPNQFRIGRAI